MHNAGQSCHLLVPFPSRVWGTRLRKLQSSVGPVARGRLAKKRPLLGQGWPHHLWPQRPRDAGLPGRPRCCRNLLAGALPQPPGTGHWGFGCSAATMQPSRKTSVTTWRRSGAESTLFQSCMYSIRPYALRVVSGWPWGGRACRPTGAHKSALSFGTPLHPKPILRPHSRGPCCHPPPSQGHEPARRRCVVGFVGSGSPFDFGFRVSGLGFSFGFRV